jgi:glutamyl-tRNA synthetase
MKRWKTRLKNKMSNIRVRFAPSPTGIMHIGGIRTALFNWLWAKKNGGKFILRIEDTDQERSTPESKQVILDSLKWLNIDWDEGPEVGGEHGPYLQMERLNIYQEFANKLISSGKAYRCYCTKEELDKQREDNKFFKYPGTCRDNRAELDKPFIVRFKATTEGFVEYNDKVFGNIKTPNKENQDFPLLRSDGIPLYNFGAVVDDLTMMINLVARGRDHMINTPLQILLYQALDAPIPEFAHLPMMLSPSGKKLSKRDGAVGVFEYRDAGYSPNAVLNYLARFGWSFGDQEIFSLPQLIESFSWDNCGKKDGKFDTTKFLWVQHTHLKKLELTPDKEYIERTLPFLTKLNSSLTSEHIEGKLNSIRPRAKTFQDAAKLVSGIK